MVLLLVTMLQITHAVYIQATSSVSQSKHVLLKYTSEYIKNFCWSGGIWKNSKTLEELWSGYRFQVWSPVKAHTPNTSELRKGLSPSPDFEQTA